MVERSGEGLGQIAGILEFIYTDKPPVYVKLSKQKVQCQEKMRKNRVLGNTFKNKRKKVGRQEIY